MHLSDDCLVDSRGLLRSRLKTSEKAITASELFIQEVSDDNLFPLATRNHDQLLELLAKYGLPVPQGPEGD